MSSTRTAILLCIRETIRATLHLAPVDHKQPA